jgi:hypothetical protein
MADVVFIGGGPAAWWTAVQAKILNPDLEIVMLERYYEYQRKHGLQIDPSSFIGIPFHPQLQEIVEGFKTKQIVPTSEIEEKLSKLGEELGIRLRYTKVIHPESLMRSYRDTKIFIGADGAHSIVREEIFGNEMESDQDLQYIAEVKYLVAGNSRKLAIAKEAYRASKLTSSVMIEQVGKSNEQGQTPISLRIFIDKKTFEEMQAATFKDPYSLDSEMNSILEEKIRIWLNAKELFVGESRVEGSEKITVTKLSIYESKKMVKHLQERIWALVGDAAFGVPFFRSMNNALLCGTQLARSIVDGKFSRYENYVKGLAYYEIFKAKIKNLVLNLWYYYVWYAGHHPIQINKWSYAQAQQLRMHNVTHSH